MKLLYKSLPLAGLCMMLSPALHALEGTEGLSTLSTIEYPEPVESCVKEEMPSQDLTQFTFDYTFVLPEEHLGQEGDIFVAFRLKSDPNKIHLQSRARDDNTGVNRWSLYDPNMTVVDYNFSAATLKPIVTLNIIDASIDVTFLENEGEILVGYGLKMHEGDTTDDIFKEMLANERYSSVKVIGVPPITTIYICSEVIKVTKRFDRITTTNEE